MVVIVVVVVVVAVSPLQWLSCGFCVGGGGWLCLLFDFGTLWVLAAK